jgi:hypothetical protein
MTRGRVNNLLQQLLLGLTRAVALGSKPRRTHDHILLSHLRLLHPGGPGQRIYISQEQGGPVIPPDPGFPSHRLLRLARLRRRYLTRHHTSYFTVLYCIVRHSNHLLPLVRPCILDTCNFTLRYLPFNYCGNVCLEECTLYLRESPKTNLMK